MKLFCHILIFVLIITSCKTKEKSDAVTQFKYYIGTDNFDSIEYFIKTMEAKFEETYSTGSLDKNYQLYLSNILKGDSKIEFTKNDCNGFRAYGLSGMENKGKQEKYDTVFFDSAGWTVTIFNGDTSWSDEIAIGDTSEDVKLNRIINEGFYMPVHRGKLLGSLKLAAKTDSLALGYYDFRYNTGGNLPKITAEYLLSIKLKPSESYFYKLIVLVELYYLQLKEYGCLLNSINSLKLSKD